MFPPASEQCTNDKEKCHLLPINKLYYTIRYIGCMREGLQWKAHSHEARVARTWNGKPDPPAGGARPNFSITLTKTIAGNRIKIQASV